MNVSATHEEADTRILLHVNDAQLHGFKRVVNVCRGTDVLVINTIYHGKFGLCLAQRKAPSMYLSMK